MSRRRLTSEIMIERLKAAKYFKRRMELSLTCWRLKEDGIEYTEEQRKLINQASSHLHEASKLVNQVYAEMIGKAIVSEL